VHLPGCLATAGWKGVREETKRGIRRGNRQEVLKKEEEEGDLGDVRGK